MPIFASISPFDGDVEKATSEMNTVEDWSLIMDICDKVKTTPNGPKDCLRSIVKRLNHRVPFVAMQSLTMLHACVNNCGRDFHLEICSRDFMSECRLLIGPKAHPRVAQKLKFLIKMWAEMKEFREDPALNLVPSFYESLKKEGQEFYDPDAAPKKTMVLSKDPNVAQSLEEEDDIAKAIALSLAQNKHASSHKTSSMYLTTSSFSPPGSSTVSTARTKEVRKVRALYDFEAVEDNELTFKSGELISVLDDSDPNWWKGSNMRGEGLFPSNFVTADLSVEPEESKKKVVLHEEMEVKTLESPEENEIDEVKIDKALELIQNADPTGEINPDSREMLQLEEQCKAMGPLIDAELEKIDRNHAELCNVNTRVLEALQLYHNLMKESPLPFSYKSMGYNPGTMSMPPAVSGGHMSFQLPVFSGPQYMLQGPMPGMSQGQGPMQNITQVQMPQISQSPMSMPQVQGQMILSQGSVMPGQQPYTTASNQNYNNSASIQGMPDQQQLGYNSASAQPVTNPQQNVVPTQHSIPSPQNVSAGFSQSHYVPQNTGVTTNMAFTDLGLPGHPGQMYQQPISHHQLL